MRIAVTIVPFSTLPLPYVDEEGGDEGVGEGGDEGKGEGEGEEGGRRKRWFIITEKLGIILSGGQQQ